ncbi:MULTISPECIES: replication initiator protein A [unclassified Fusobacterium]|uniref:replication initiator protein A n=1 Tax=unclassified Fusobacterium TaxID=2648384 RepID=UPI001B8D6F8B|nr:MULTISPECIES: replication initiator protein A [unclassified Fusobacterium]
MRTMTSTDLENLDYYQVPKWLMRMFLSGEITAGGFKTYTLMYNRLRISAKNGWVNAEGEVYIKYSYNEMVSDLKCNSKTTVSNNIKELLKLGMIVQKKKFNASSCYFLTVYDGEKITNNESTKDYTSTEDCTTTKNCTTISTEDCTYTSTENCTHSSTENLYASNNNRVRITKSKNNFSKNNIGDQLQNENIGSDLKEKIIEYIAYRKEIKKPIKTYKVISGIISRIGKDFKDEKHLILSIDYSMSNQWQGVFPAVIKQQNNIQKESIAQKYLKNKRLM